MCKKLIYVTLLFLLGLMAIPVGVVSAEDIVAVDAATGTLFRQTDGQVVWSTTTSVSGVTLLDIGPDGNVYASTSNNKDFRKWDGQTGEFLGDILTIGNRLYDTCFGPDVDGDGIEDMYTFEGAGAVVNSYTSSSGYTEQGSFTATVDGGAWVGDFGPDITGDGVKELYVLPDLAQNTSNVLKVIDGATKTEHLSVPIPEVVRPGCLVAGSDGRIYITGRNNDVVVSYLPDGTDAQVVADIDAVNFAQQIFEGKPGEWWIANRFNVTGLPDNAGSVVFSLDSWATTSILIAGTVADDNYSAIASFDSPGKEGLAKAPDPENGATDVVRDADLTWTAGDFAVEHEVYFGSSFDDVNDATTASDAYRVRQNDTSFDPGRMELGETYFWRIDEVNDTNPNSPWKGDVWSFTVEPFAYPIEDIIANASSNDLEQEPENIVNGSGLDENGLLHGNDSTGTMWISSLTGDQPSWIAFEFDRLYKLHDMWIWNYNESWEQSLGVGIKEATIEYSVDGGDFITLGATHEFDQGPGTVDYPHNTTIDFEGVAAKHVKITANSNWGGGILDQYGLSEVRISYVPVAAREPSPVSGATDVDVDVILNWRAGREAASHDVYISMDEQAVIDGTAPKVTLPEASYVPDLVLGMTYYWRVDEVNDLEDPAVWVGSVQSFSTSAYIVVDDMEFYKSDDGKWIWETWTDGFEIPSNGALLGHSGDDMETGIVYGGSQSLPYYYGQDGAAVSEATLPIDAQDWSKYGIKSLSLYFHGTADNVPGQLYVKINDTRFDYQGATTDIQTAQWFPFTIDLTGVTVVNSLTIGVAGGEGTIYVDDIRLYAQVSELINPIVPDTTELLASYSFEGNYQDGSGNGLHGAAVGAAAIISDAQQGSVLSLDGVDSSVDLGSDSRFNFPGSLTLAVWVNIPDFTEDWCSILSNRGENDIGWHLRRYSTSSNLAFTLRGTDADDDLQGIVDMSANFNEWIQVTGVYDMEAGKRSLYINGMLDVDVDDGGVVTAAAHNVYIGARANSANNGQERPFTGLVDDVKIYNRALSQAEALGLTGRTDPVYKPF